MRPRDVFNQAIRVHRVLWAALTASHALLLVVLFVQRGRLDTSRAVPSAMVLALGLAAVGCAVVSGVLPARALAQDARLRPQEVLRPEPTGGYQPPARFTHPVKSARHCAGVGTTALVLKMALAEAVSLDGFVLGFLGAPPTTFLPFFAVGIVLAALRFPTVERLIGPYERAHGATFAASDDPAIL